MRTPYCADLPIRLVLFLLALSLGSCQEQPSEPSAPAAAIPNDWFFRQRAYPSGQIDQRAYRKAVQLQQAERQKRSSATPWTFRGPLNTGGRIAALAVHPDFPDTIFVGAASGGVFRSFDRGLTFEPVFDDALTLSIGAMALAPSDPQTLYVGTGESNAGGGSIAYDGIGMYKSTDGGNSFEPIGLASSGSIGRIAVHPDNPGRVYVAAVGRLYGKNPERGIYRSSDGGQSWEQSLFVNDSTGGVDLEMHPTRPDTLYAATWERVRGPGFYKYGGAGSGIYRTYDGGDHWERLSTGLPDVELGRIGLAVSPADPQVVYAKLIDPFGEMIDVYRSNDGGDSWFATGTVGFSGPNFMWWFGRLFPHPTDTETLFLPSVNLYRTTNGGGNWSVVSSGVHVDHHDLYINPNNPDYLVLGNDGGLYISEDNAQTWSHRKSLPITQFYTCAIDYSDPTRRYGGTQDNGTVRTTSGGLDNWQPILGGDGFYCLIDPTDNRYVYAESQYGRLRRSTNGGVSFQFALGGILSAERRNWSTPVVFNPLNPKSLYYGSVRLYKSENRAAFWSPISEDLTGPEDPGNLAYGTLTSISVSAVDTNLIYVGTDNGRVWKTTDGGQDWALLSAELPDRWVTRVVTCPSDAQTAYVTFSGYRFDDYLPYVFKTTDGGQSWSPAADGLPEVPVNVLVIDPDQPAHLYLGNDVGVFVSYNGGANWQPLGQGLPTVVIGDLCLHEPTQELYVSTYGRSMYSLPLPPAPSVAGPLQGQALRPDSAPLPGVQAYLLGLADTLVTDAAGGYAFVGLSPGQPYTMAFRRDGDDINGVSTLDLILINKHILGITPFDSPYQLIAADANASGSITTLDMIQLRKLILSIDTELSAQDSWRFVLADYNFPEPGNPWSQPWPEQWTSPALSSAIQTVPTVIGIKIGDVNGDAIVQ